MQEPLACHTLLGHEDYPELDLKTPDLQFQMLADPIPCHFIKLAGKHLEDRSYPAALTGLATGQGLLATPGPLAPFDNIILRLGGSSDTSAPAELYGKVGRILADQSYLLHFTSVSPAMQAELDRALEKQSA